MEYKLTKKNLLTSQGKIWQEKSCSTYVPELCSINQHHSNKNQLFKPVIAS